jgi:hypothetical protein
MSKVIRSKEDAIELLENFSIIEKAEYFRRMDEYVGSLYKWRDVEEASLESLAASAKRSKSSTTLGAVFVGCCAIGLFLHHFRIYEFDIGVEVLPAVLIICLAHEIESIRLAAELKRQVAERKRLERKIDATNIRCHKHYVFLGDAFDGDYLRVEIEDELPCATLRAMGVKGVLGTRQY